MPWRRRIRTSAQLVTVELATIIELLAVISSYYCVDRPSGAPTSPRCSQLFAHASPNIGSITKAQPTTFWDTIYFYTASATVGNQSSIVPRETSHHERDGLMTTCGCLFGIVCLNKTSALERCRREKRRALSTRVEIFANGGSID